MKPFLIFCLMLITAATSAQTVQNNQIIIGKTDSINSKILGEKRRVWVYLPSRYGDVYTKQTYPVIYLLDGDGHFASVAGMIQQLTEVNGNTVLPEMIIVAILNTDRTRDLTPTNSMVDPNGSKQEFLRSSGGGEKFINFMQKELMPHIDSAYRTAPYKILIGHSFGGLTAVNVLVNHPDMFNAYIAIDPSMWWDGKKLLNQTREVLAQQKFKGKSFFLGIANTMPDGMDTLQVRRDTTGTTGHIRSILELKDILQSNTGNDLKWAYRYYNNDNHGSVPLIAEYDGLHFLFNFYKMPSNKQFALYDPKSKADVAAALTSYYAGISEHMGYKISPPEGIVNEMGYYYLQSHMEDKAYAMFALNISNYPQSANTYDSMGDYYNAKKDKPKAIEFFTKAYNLGKNPDTKKKLDDLQVVAKK